MIEVGTRAKSQPPPPWVVFEALTQPNRDPARQWLQLLDDECPPEILEAVEPELVVWSSIWLRRPDARIRFDLSGSPADTTMLRWTLLVDEPMPDDELLGHLCKRVQQLINAELRYSFGQ